MNANPCPYCGALPCDWVNTPPANPTELMLLLADCRQALFDAVKVDGGATSSLRYEVGRAIALMGRAMAESELPPA